MPKYFVSAVTATRPPATNSEPVLRSCRPRSQKNSVQTKPDSMGAWDITQAAEERTTGDVNTTGPASVGGAASRAARQAVPTVAAIAGSRKAAWSTRSVGGANRETTAIEYGTRGGFLVITESGCATP